MRRTWNQYFSLFRTKPWLWINCKTKAWTILSNQWAQRIRPKRTSQEFYSSNPNCSRKRETPRPANNYTRVPRFLSKPTNSSRIWLISQLTITRHSKANLLACKPRESSSKLVRSKPYLLPHFKCRKANKNKEKYWIRSSKSSNSRRMRSYSQSLTKTALKKK